MKKYEGLLPEERPATFQGLPELHYPKKLNIAHALLEGAIAKGFGTRIAYFCSGRRITYETVRREVHRQANALRQAGLREGDRVILRQDDTAALIYSILALQALGAIAVPTYVQLRADDLTYRINDSSAKAIIVEPKLIGEIEGLQERCPSLRHVLITPSDPKGEFSSLGSEYDSAPMIYADTDADDICLILYTSGSTGQPKGTCHCHADLLSTPDKSLEPTILNLGALARGVTTFNRQLTEAEPSVRQQLDQAIAELVSFSDQTLGRLDIN